MSLPWFKAPTSGTVAGMLKHSWSKACPCPAYVAALELLALEADGLRDGYSVRDLASRWGWSKSRTDRYLRGTLSGQCSATKRDSVQEQYRTVAADAGTLPGQKRDASRTRSPLVEREREVEVENNGNQVPTVPSWVPSGKEAGLTREQLHAETLKAQEQLLTDYRERMGPRAGPRSWAGRIKGRGQTTRQRALCLLIAAEGVDGALATWAWYLTERLDKGYGGDGIDTFLEKSETYAGKTREDKEPTAAPQHTPPPAPDLSGLSVGELVDLESNHANIQALRRRRKQESL